LEKEIVVDIIGKQHDPEVVDALLKLVYDKPLESLLNGTIEI
jgi:hypothetical protein